MNLHTEKEFLNNSIYFGYKLKNLHHSNPTLFKEVASFLPNLIYVTKEDSLRIENSVYLYHNHNNVLIQSEEMQELAIEGASMLPKISCPVLLHNLSLKIKEFKRVNDFDTSVSYF